MDNLCLHSEIYYIWILCGCVWSLEGETSSNLFSFPPPSQPTPHTHTYISICATHTVTSPTPNTHAHVHTHTHPKTVLCGLDIDQKVFNFCTLILQLDTYMYVLTFTHFLSQSMFGHMQSGGKTKPQMWMDPFSKLALCFAKCITSHRKLGDISYRIEDVF